MLADNWWFWALVALVLVGAIASRDRYARGVARLRRAALGLGLIALPPGQTLAGGARAGRDVSWIGLLAGIWVVLGPWIWGYDDVDGALATDAVTGGLVIGLALAGTVFPALWALNVLAGLWLVVAPWLVGYGDANGPVGLSDTLAGIVIAAVALAVLAEAERAVRPGAGPGPVGRIRPRR
jgi:hypothetical protein